MGEKDDHQDFLAGLPDVTPKPAASQTEPPAPTMDDGALHLAATLTELKISNQRLHADLAQRIRALEAKVDAGLPDWDKLTARLVQAGQEGGQKATERLVAANAETVKQANQISELRADDIRLFRAVVTGRRHRSTSSGARLTHRPRLQDRLAGADLVRGHRLSCRRPHHLPGLPDAR